MTRRSPSGQTRTAELRRLGEKMATGLRCGILTAAVVLLTAGSGCSGQGRESELLVFGAASLADVLTEVGEALETETGARTAFNFAGSNLLARQIDAGAPAAVFVSADRAQVDWLEARGGVSPGAARTIAGNALVLVTPGDEGASLRGPADLLSVKTLILADPAGVPAGVHAKAWLEREGYWAQLADRVIPALDVRAALAAVAAGDVDAGIVYATDARSTSAVTVAFVASGESAPAVRYVAAPVDAGNPEAHAFVAYLQGPEAQAIFARHGFTSPSDGGAS